MLVCWDSAVKLVDDLAGESCECTLSKEPGRVIRRRRGRRNCWKPGCKRPRCGRKSGAERVEDRLAKQQVVVKANRSQASKTQTNQNRSVKDGKGMPKLLSQLKARVFVRKYWVRAAEEFPVVSQVCTGCEKSIKESSEPSPRVAAALCEWAQQWHLV